MTEQRFTNVGGVEEYVHLIFDNKTAKTLSVNQTVKKLNEQQDHISYWKHKVNGLLWILSQFDEEKVKELLKELEDE